MCIGVFLCKPDIVSVSFLVELTLSESESGYISGLIGCDRIIGPDCVFAAHRGNDAAAVGHRAAHM